MKKKLLQIIFIALWVAILFSLGIYYLFFAPRNSEFTETENRNLAAFPQVSAQSLFSGQFGEEIETYLLDRFPLRNTAIEITNRMESLLSLATYEDYLLIAENVEDPLDTALNAADLDALLAEDVILSSNTSTLNLFDFVTVSHPERLILTHFFKVRV